MHEQSRYRQARMTRKKNKPLSYAPHSVSDVHSDRTGGIETMLQHLASLRATRKRYRIKGTMHIHSHVLHNMRMNVCRGSA